MGRWAFMLGGLIVWAVHFLGVYAIASLADVMDRADAFAWRMGGLAFSGMCLVASLAHLALALRRVRSPRSEGSFRLVDEFAALGAGLAAIAILWQALPTVVGY